jgi:hypothetical protein
MKADWETLDWFIDASDGAKRIDFKPDLNGKVADDSGSLLIKRLSRVQRNPLKLTTMREYKDMFREELPDTSSLHHKKLK